MARMVSSPSPRTPGASFGGRYVVQRKLGSGSLGTVYLARDLALDRAVALKVLKTPETDEASRARMRAEFQTIVQLRHPQIAEAYDLAIADGGVPYYTREYIAGAPLPPGPPAAQPPAEYLQPILDLLDALDHVHGRGILHLDIHAGNLIVADDPSRGAVLIDFDLMRSGEKTPLDQLGGSCSALPPELLEGAKLSSSTDVFLVGRLIHYRLTGRTQGRPDLPREIPGWGTRLTLELERIVHKATHRLPERRFESASDLRSALEAALGAARAQRAGRDGVVTLVGRDAELARVERVLRDALRGSSGAVWVFGGHGSGKSAVLHEAKLRAQLLGLDTVAIRCAQPRLDVDALVRCLRVQGADRGRSAGWLDALEPENGGTPRERARRAAETFFSSDGPALVLLLDDADAPEREALVLVHALAAEASRRAKARIGGRGLAIILASTKRPPTGVRAGAAGFVEVTLRALRTADAKRLLGSLVARPLPAPLLSSATLGGKGNPGRLRQLATGVAAFLETEGRFPDASELPAILHPLAGVRAPGSPPGDPIAAEILDALALFEYEATRQQLAAALDRNEDVLRGALHRLERLEVLNARGRGSSRTYQIGRAELAEEARRSIRPAFASRLHARAATYWNRAALEGKALATARERRAYHLLASGQLTRGVSAAVDAAARLRSHGLVERAARLLRDAAAHSREPAAKFALTSEACALLETKGDPERAIDLLEPLRAGGYLGLTCEQRVNVLRRLGVGYHRLGEPKKALEAFEEAQRHAEAERDRAELVLIDSELAEIHIFLGSLETAEAACRRGLERLDRGKIPPASRGRFEVMLRASLGHIALRNLDLPRAKEELERALQLSRKHSTRSDRAAIIHNLGVVENELNHLASARKHFVSGEKLLLAAGERRDTIKVATNLALIDAKLGDRAAARAAIARAEELLRQHSGQRLECFTCYSKGLVALLFGEVEEAELSLDKAVSIARSLNDATLGAFAEVAVAEVHLLSGRYAKALVRLHSVVQRAAPKLPVVVLRMARARLLLLESLLGRTRRAMRHEKALDALPRTNVEYLEAWNDVFHGLAWALSGKNAEALAAKAEEFFQRCEVAAGERFARLVRHLSTIDVHGSASGAEVVALAIPNDASRDHAFLRVAEALWNAAASRAKSFEAAEIWLSAASSGIIGFPFLELDWLLEFLRARVALKQSGLQEARRHLHRAVHSCELLASQAPASSRKKLLEQPRFRALQELYARLKAAPEVLHSTRGLRERQEYAGMVGRSAAMLALFHSIERLRGLEAPVLITGETGTGKELVSRALVERGARRGKPVHVVPCACLPPELFESEFFGHAAGAFTGAERDLPGLLESAHGGTLILDEIGQLALESQAKLLRVLDSGSVRRVGSASARTVDVRFLAISGADLRAEAEQGRFRKDLLYRLSGVELRVPPLRDRRDDVPLLAAYFLERHGARLDRPVASLDPAALAQLCQHDWPGNVRELEMLLLQALVTLPQAERLTGDGIAKLLQQKSPPRAAVPLLERRLEAWREDLERDYLTQLFRKREGDLKAMMRDLGVGSTKLYAWLRKLGLSVRQLRKRL